MTSAIIWFYYLVICYQSLQQWKCYTVKIDNLADWTWTQFEQCCRLVLKAFYEVFIVQYRAAMIRRSWKKLSANYCDNWNGAFCLPDLVAQVVFVSPWILCLFHWWVGYMVKLFCVCLLWEVKHHPQFNDVFILRLTSCFGAVGNGSVVQNGWPHGSQTPRTP